MSNKIPCGGFYLDDMLNVNDSGELSINGGTPYQQLVTDGNGNTRWEDRPFYDKALVSVPHPEVPGFFWYKVSDVVPTGDYSLHAHCNYITGGSKTESTIFLSTDDYYAVSEFAVVVALKGNVVIEGITFPEKGTYFLAGEGFPLITGFALGLAADPEITWDGSTGEIKTLDEKFLPPVSGLIVKSSTSDSTKRFRITVDDTGTISATEVT